MIEQWFAFNFVSSNVNQVRVKFFEVLGSWTKHNKPILLHRKMNENATYISNVEISDVVHDSFLIPTNTHTCTPFTANNGIQTAFYYYLYIMSCT